jgi:phosphoribosylformimino-5-aminoimidazole carboxamide ribotide isomerase
VIGTKAVEDPKFVHGLVAGFGGDAIAVGVDAREGKVAVKGWAEVTHLDALEFIDQICNVGVGTIIFTDIATDGMLSGPSFGTLEAILRTAKCQVIASGGVATMEDVRRLASFSGLYGTIIGKALFVGTIELSEAVAVANAASDARGAV